jgi:hypothetical protein
MVVGSIWFGPLFGKEWIRLSGLTPEKLEAAKKKGMGKTYAVQFVGSLVMAYVMAHSLVFASSYLKVSGLTAGLTTGFWNWLGFVAPVTLGAVLWEGKPLRLWALNNGCQLVTMLVMGVILASM